MSDSNPNPPASQAANQEWFAPVDPRTGDPGLRFSCTMCGQCCTGPEGFVMVSDDERQALAARLGLSVDEFTERYTRPFRGGRSLIEKLTSFGHDCVFLDREKIPGKAVCGVYEDRPAQCRTWPFWRTNLSSQAAWERAKRICPGMDKGTLVPVSEIRIRRETFDI